MGRQRRSESREARSRSRERRQRRSSPANAIGGRGTAEAEPETGDHLYRLELTAGKGKAALPVYDVILPDDENAADIAARSAEPAQPPRRVRHVCARPGEGYAICVHNESRRHISCVVHVDGESTLLKDGSLIVAPGDKRELPGYLVSKNFVGREYVKEYRDFRFGKPNVVEMPNASSSSSTARPTFDQPYTSYGVITCDVYEAVLDEEIPVEKELRGQTTWYRGAGLHGSFEDRQVPEGKKSHLVYSSVTVQGPRSSISNTTAGRWWVRGDRKLRTLEMRYREAHSLMLLGVDPADLGLMVPKDERDMDDSRVKKEEWEDKQEKEEKFEDTKTDIKGRLRPGLVEVCDLTAEDAEDAAHAARAADAEASSNVAGLLGGSGRVVGAWSVREAPPTAEPVSVYGS